MGRFSPTARLGGRNRIAGAALILSIVVVEQKGDKLANGLKATLQPCGSANVRFVNSEEKPILGRSPGHVELMLTPGESLSAGLFLMSGRKKQSPVLADSIFMANLDPQRYRNLKTDAEGRMTFPTLIPGATAGWKSSTSRRKSRSNSP